MTQVRVYFFAGLREEQAPAAVGQRTTNGRPYRCNPHLTVGACIARPPFIAGRPEVVPIGHKVVPTVVMGIHTVGRGFTPAAVLRLPKAISFGASQHHCALRTSFAQRATSFAAGKPFADNLGDLSLQS